MAVPPAPVVLVLSDGLGDTAARGHMGFLEHLVAERRATRFTSRAALPTTSRPNYETLHTGVVPAVHGVTSNLVVRSSARPNTFSLASRAGLVTAASAYSWVSELYVRSPFDPGTDMEVSDPSADLRYGRFYMTDAEPDEEVFARAATLTSHVRPDYLLVHPMGCDTAGHGEGGGSPAYARAVSLQDHILATLVPVWNGLGYTVIVTADHGHLPEGGHGGTHDEVVNTPLYVVPSTGVGGGDTGETVPSTRVAATVWRLLGIEGPPDAAAPLDLPAP